MKVDTYKVESSAIADVIDKLAEAEGAMDSTIRTQYLAEAASLLVEAVREACEPEDDDGLNEAGRTYLSEECSR